MYRLIEKVYPRKLREHYAQLMVYNNLKKDISRFLTHITILSVVVSLLFSLILLILIDFSFTFLWIFSFFLVEGIIYSFYLLSADARARFVEGVLPDALQLMSSNLRAGMTIDRALLLSSRPEFGAFQEDINQVGKEITTGKEFDKALLELGKRIKSERLQKTFQVIISGIASGGQLADLLEQTASNLRQQKLVEERVRSSVLIYVIFIFAAIGFGAPVLFGLSSFLIEVITDIFGKIELPPTTLSTQLPLKFGKVNITPEFVVAYTIISMIATSIMGSLIIGLISRGKEKEGFKYIPILIVITISLFFIVRFLIRNLLAGLFQI